EIGDRVLECAERAVIPNVKVLRAELQLVGAALIIQRRVSLIEVLRPAERDRVAERTRRGEVTGQDRVAVGLTADDITDQEGGRNRRAAQWLFVKQPVVDEARFGHN